MARRQGSILQPRGDGAGGGSAGDGAGGVYGGAPDAADWVLGGSLIAPIYATVSRDGYFTTSTPGATHQTWISGVGLPFRPLDMPTWLDGGE